MHPAIPRPRVLASLACAVLLAGCGAREDTGPAASVNPPAVVASPSALPAVPVYPATRREDAVDARHGLRIPDPWRWLENDVRQDSEVAAWVEQQNRLSGEYLAALPGRDAIRERLTTLWDYEKFGVPEQQGGRYFYRRNDGLQNQSVLFVQDGLEGAPRVLLDPNTWSADGATALDAALPSPDGKRLLYAVQDGGSDWRRLRVIDVDSGETLPDDISWVKFSDLAWASDGSGFYYARYPEPPKGEEFQSANYGHEIRFHRLGDPQSADRLVYSRPEQPTHGFGFRLSDDGRWLVINVWIGTDDVYEIVVQDLAEPGAAPRILIGGFEHDYALAGTEGSTLWFRTNRDAPRSRIVAIDAADPAPERWREIVPESEATLVDARLLGGVLVADYLQDAHSAVRFFAPDGTARGELALPGLGSVSGFEGEQDELETFYAFSSFNQPTTIYRLDLASGQSSVFRRPETPFDPADYVVEQRFYTSKDGTRVPLFLARRKDVAGTSPMPALLYGYGGFNIPMVPRFSVGTLAWMEMGGIYAVANLRGGGEYGKAWHDAGRRANKQNVFDDFIAAAEYLVAEGLSTPRQLAIQGGSNGGLLVGAVVNQRPDLFAAALPAVGVMDMLRFDAFTAGRFWTDDYGDPDEPADHAVLRAYSPYHNIHAAGRYPAILVTTADTDDRVVPGHSFKYTAALQAAEPGPAPRLIRIETRAGHGAGKPTDKLIAELADQWTFIAAHTGLTVPAR
jgi:prolyl oligopeptidase